MRVSLEFLAFGAVALCCGLGCSASGSPAAVDKADGGNADGGLAPVRIIRGDPAATSWFSLAIEGHGLANAEGRVVTVRIGMAERPPERLGSAQVRIESGAFRVDLPQAAEISLYKRKLLFIDMDGDGTCTAGADHVYSDNRAQEGGDLMLTLSDSVPAPASGAAMGLAPDAATATPSCQVFNDPWPES
jgi:hypothetical protein